MSTPGVSPTVGPTGAGLTLTRGTAAAQVTSPGAFAANLPAGLTLVTDTDFSATQPEVNGYGTDGLAYVWNGRKVTDGTSPYTTNVFETFYPGNDAGNGEGGALIFSPDGSTWRQMYFALWVWLPADYSMHTNGEKFFYPVPTGGGTGFMVGWGTRDRFLGSGGGATVPTYCYFLDAQRGDGNITPTHATYPVKGAWQKHEVYMRMNTGTSFNGVFQVWVDGVQVFNRTDVRYSLTGETFNGIRFSGTRGGGASSVLTPPGGQVRRYARLAFYASNT